METMNASDVASIVAAVMQVMNAKAMSAAPAPTAAELRQKEEAAARKARFWEKRNKAQQSAALALTDADEVIGKQLPEVAHYCIINREFTAEEATSLYDFGAVGIVGSMPYSARMQVVSANNPRLGNPAAGVAIYKSLVMEDGSVHADDDSEVTVIGFAEARNLLATLKFKQRFAYMAGAYAVLSKDGVDYKVANDVTFVIPGGADKDGKALGITDKDGNPIGDMRVFMRRDLFAFLYQSAQYKPSKLGVAVPTPEMHAWNELFSDGGPDSYDDFRLFTIHMGAYNIATTYGRTATKVADKHFLEACFRYDIGKMSNKSVTGHQALAAIKDRLTFKAFCEGNRARRIANQQVYRDSRPGAQASRVANAQELEAVPFSDEDL